MFACACCREELNHERAGDRDDGEVKKDVVDLKPAFGKTPSDPTHALDGKSPAVAQVLQTKRSGLGRSNSLPLGNEKKKQQEAQAEKPEEPAKKALRLQQKGDAAFEREAWDEAVQAYTEAIKACPTSLGNWTGRGGVKLRTGDYGGAVADLDQALRLDPDCLFALRDRAEAKFRSGDHYGALADYNRKLTLAPGDGRALCGRGEARLATGDRAGGLSDLQLAVQLTYPGAADLLAKAKKGS